MTQTNFFETIQLGNVSLVKELFDCRENELSKEWISQGLFYSRNRQITRFLMEKGADIHYRYRGYTPLTFASEKDYENIVKDLIRSGVHVNELDDNNRSALFYCAMNKNIELVKLLFEEGAKVDFCPDTIDEKCRCVLMIEQEYPNFFKKRKQIQLFYKNIRKSCENEWDEWIDQADTFLDETNIVSVKALEELCDRFYDNDWRQIITKLESLLSQIII